MPNASPVPLHQTPPQGRKWSGAKWIKPVKRMQIYLRDKFTCCFCDATTNLSLDHVIPKSQGGHNYESNLLTCCERCNKRRQDMHFETFMQRVAPKDYKKRIIRAQRCLDTPIHTFRREADMVLAERRGTKPN